MVRVCPKKKIDSESGNDDEILDSQVPYFQTTPRRS